MPAVSVIVPLYKVEPYAARCARSIFGQTLGDMEFIFIDDCSPDRSTDVIREVLGKEFPKRLSQARFHRMERNSGQAKVRMKGLELAKGDYIIQCDADDYLEPDAYELMYGEAKKSGADIVSCDYLKGEGENWERSTGGSEPGKELSDILTGRVMGSLCLRLVRRSITEGLVPPAGNMAEDMALAVQLTCRARTFSHVPKALYHYCVRQDSISREAGLQAALSRQESLRANTELSVKELVERYGHDAWEPDIVYFKYRSRAPLEPYVHRPEVRSRWLESFPEVDGVFLRTKGIPFPQKFWFALIHLRLYHPWKLLSGKHPCCK